MKLHPFYLFYVLAIVFLAIGFLATEAETYYSMSSSAPGIAVAKNLNRPYFLAASTLSLLTGLLYHCLFKSGRIASKAIIIIHGVIAALGIVFSLNLYRLILLLTDSGIPDTTSLGAGRGGLLLMLPGPLFLIASLIIFIVGFVTTKRIQT